MRPFTLLMSLRSSSLWRQKRTLILGTARNYSRSSSNSDRRVERYWQLIGIINDWPEQPSLMPAYDWLIAALQAHT